MIQLAALGLTFETAAFALAGFFFLQRQGYTFAEAGAGAILFLFIAFSLVHQVDLLTGSPWPGFVVEFIALAAVLIVGWRRKPSIVRWLQYTVGLIRRETFPAVSLAAAWTAMALYAVVGWGAADGLQAIAAPSDWTQSGLALLGDSHGIPPLNIPALFYHTARFGLPPEACGFGLLAHIAVGLCTYALARRYSWPPMALTIALMVVSMPRLVLLALHPSAELISVASVCVCVLLLYRLVEQHRVWDLRFFLICLAFSLHSHPMSAALIMVMALLLIVVVIRRHGWILWREMIVARPLPTILLMLLAAVLVQVPILAWNLAHDYPLFGTVIVFDMDGIIGAAANLVRYLFLSIDPTEAVRNALEWLVGLDLNRLMKSVYNLSVVSLFGQSGASAPFVPVFSGMGHAGFGPFVALLVLPAMVHAALRGPRRLKALSVAWAGYLYLAALVIAWTTDNIVVLTPLYAANGFMVAFSLPPWRLRRRGMRLLQVLFVLLLAGSLVHGGRPAP